MTERTALSPPAWQLRYAPHVGYLPPFQPLFSELAGGTHLEEQVRFIAGQGFSGVLHPWIASQPAESRREFARMLRDHDLAAGCVVYTGLEQIMRPLWTSDADADRTELLEMITKTADAAAEVGSSVMAVLVIGNADQPMDRQLSNVRENLALAGRIAASRQMVLGVEPMQALPGMLFPTASAAADLLREMDDPAVRLIFDTAHIAAMEGDVLSAQENLADVVCLYQLADAPDRTEPGSGTIDFPALLARLMSQKYDGLVELEHGWSTDGADAQREGLKNLSRIDARAADLRQRAAAGLRPLMQNRRIWPTSFRLRKQR